MALYGEIPRGLQQLVVNVLTNDTPGANILVPGSRGLTWNVESDSDTLEGDNAIIATVRNPKSLSGSVEIGRIGLTPLAAMAGGVVGSSGVTPNVILALDETASAVASYFQAVGQTYSQDTGTSGYRATLKKLLVVSGPNESLTTGEWNTPTLDFEGVARGGSLLTRAGYEAYVALT